MNDRYGIAQIKQQNRDMRTALQAASAALERALVENELLHSRISTATDKQILLLERLIAADERVQALELALLDQDFHLNPADKLPPVECPILVEIAPQRLVAAERTGFISSKGSEMEYRVSDGNVIMGRLRWTYP